MKNFTKKSLSVLLSLLMIFSVLTVGFVSVSATTPDTLYFVPSSNWKEYNVRFAAYFMFGDGTATEDHAWVSVEPTDTEGVYQVDVPAGGWSQVIFCRMNGSAQENNWNNKWNQTADLKIPVDGKNCCTLDEGEWDGDYGTWSVYNAGGTTESVTNTTAPELSENETKTYTLIGYINDKNVGCDEDWENVVEHHNFEDGKLMLSFYSTSYVFLKTTDNKNFYMFDGFCMENSGVLYNTSTYKPTAYFDKMMISPGEYEFTLVENEDGTLNLSYKVLGEDESSESQSSSASSSATQSSATESSESQTASTSSSATFDHNVQLAGSFNNWFCDEMKSDDGVVYTTTINLEPDVYSFKIVKDYSWLGNGGTIEDTTTTTSSVGWKLDENSFDNVTLLATGGEYTFSFNVETDMLIVLWNSSTESEPTESQPTEPSESKPEEPGGAENNIPDVLYFRSNNNWKEGNAKIGAYFFNETTVTNTWAPAEKNDDDIYVVSVPDGDWEYVIFCRMDPVATEESWMYVWNQTYNIRIPADGKDLFTLEEGVWDYGTGEWSEYGDSPVHPSTASSESKPVITTDKTYTLVGYIDGKDVGFNDTWDKYEEKYNFVDGKMTTVFDSDSYVIVKTTDNSELYMFDGFCTSKSGTLYNTKADTPVKDFDKMLVRAGKVEFTLVENEDGTLTLSYEYVKDTTETTESSSPELPIQYSLYFVPDKLWKEANARFSAYIYSEKQGVEMWVSAVETETEGVYKFDIPEGYWDHIIFCRMTPDKLDNKWENKWNQTEVYKIPADGINCFTITDDEWELCKGEWSVYKGDGVTEPTVPTQPTEPEGYKADLAGSFNEWHQEAMTVVKSPILKRKYILPAGRYAFKMVDGDLWYGSGSEIDNITTDLQLYSAEGNCVLNAVGGEYTFIFNTETHRLTIEYVECDVAKCTGIDPKVTLAGDFNNWEQERTFVENDEVVVVTKKLAEGTYNFKFVSNGLWYGSASSFTDSAADLQLDKTYADCVLNASGGLYTFRYNKVTHKLTVDYKKCDVEALSGPAGKVIVSGEFNYWAQDSMYKVENDVLRKTVELPRGKYQFKVVYNGLWYGCGSEIDNQGEDINLDYKSDDCILNAKGGRYTFEFNPETKKITVSYEECEVLVEADVKLSGEFNNWAQDPMSTSDGETVKTQMELPKGKYQFKIVDGGLWYGSASIFTNTAENLQLAYTSSECILDAEGGMYTFIYNVVEKTLTVECDRYEVKVKSDVTLSGDFNGWSHDVMYVESEDVVTANVTLEAGKYQFKLVKGGLWYGSGSEFTDAITDLQLNCTYSECIINSTGGTYKISYNTKTKTMSVEVV